MLCGDDANFGSVGCDQYYKALREKAWLFHQVLRRFGVLDSLYARWGFDCDSFR